MSLTLAKSFGFSKAEVFQLGTSSMNSKLTREGDDHDDADDDDVQKTSLTFSTINSEF